MPGTTDASDFATDVTRAPTERVRIECDAVPAPLERAFREPLRSALARRSGCYEVRLGQGRQPGEVLAVIRAAGRRLPLSLYFPEADSLKADDVERIVRNVLEGMGRAFP